MFVSPFCYIHIFYICKNYVFSKVYFYFDDFFYGIIFYGLILEKQFSWWYFNIHLLYLVFSSSSSSLRAISQLHIIVNLFSSAANSHRCNGPPLAILDLTITFRNILSSLSSFFFISVLLNYVSLVRNFTNDSSFELYKFELYKFRWEFYSIRIEFFLNTITRCINNERIRRTATMEHAGRETIVQEKLKIPSTIERRAQCALYRGGIKFRGVTTGLCVNLSLLSIGRCQTSYRDTHYVNYLQESLRFSIVLTIGSLNGAIDTRFHPYRIILRRPFRRGWYRQSL